MSKMNAFFASREFFTVLELDEYLRSQGDFNAKTRKALLSYHRSKGHIKTVRRGLYAVVSPFADSATHQCDPYKLACMLVPDACLSHHTSLAYQGYGHTEVSKYTFTSAERLSCFKYEDLEYVCVQLPPVLRDKPPMFVETRLENGVNLRFTSIERTLVDVLHRPDLVPGGWEEIYQCLEGIPFVKCEDVVQYVQALGNSSVAAKVGFFLETHQQQWMVDDEILCLLEAMAPKNPDYLVRGQRGGTLQKRWNLIVPDYILDRSWLELDYDEEF